MVLRKILYFGSALLLAGCAGKENLPDILSGGEKTPLKAQASLSGEASVTKAAADDFAEGDELLVYLRHTTGGSKGSYATTAADQAPKLVTFTVGSAGELTTASPLYWDDFSDSRNANTDLRTDGHGLQSYYGYCYNGGSDKITTPLVAADGTLTWTIGNQTTAEAVQHADLLWSAEQETVEYAHASAQSGDHGAITIPFTHAMSEVTVTVTCSDGFSGSSNPLSSTVLTLNSMLTKTYFTAPSASFSSGTPATVQMFGEAYTSGSLSRNYTAIVAPNTTLREGAKLLDITGVDNNDYTLTITSSMLTSSAWGTNGHSTGVVDGKTFICTKPGYNYHLNVSLKKTSMATHATLEVWKTVTATGDADIKYPEDEDDENLMMDDAAVSGVTDVQVVAVDKNHFQNGASFSLFTLKSESAYNEASARTNAVFSFATVSTFQDKSDPSNDQWNNSPLIYWPNKTDKYYFRALARFNGVTDDVNDITSVGTFDTDKGTAVSQGTIGAGHDILWGTTAQHKGTVTNQTYLRGQAIPPRTGGVPIAFEHAMSKVSFALETTTDASAVDLTGATIAISNLYTSGTITIENGTITYTDGDLTAAAIPAETAPITERIVVPQSIRNDAKVTITLTDGTTYSLQLNQCVITGGSTPIGAWERGKHYTYTIHLEKEQITFRALVKEWIPVTGSGNANLEWD